MRIVLAFVFVLIFGFNAYAVQVLVNVWDGSEYSVVENLYSQLPNLKSIGVLQHLTSNTECSAGYCMVTVTKPQHATMLTGCLGDKHFVYSNEDYKKIPDGMTILEIAKLQKNIRTALISGKALHVGLPIFANIVDEVDFYYTEDIGAYQVTHLVKDLINKWRNTNFLIVAHFRSPDAQGHMYGVGSANYFDAIKTNDKELGEILRIAPADMIVYVLSDHGFGCPNAKNHTCSPNAFFATNATTSGVVMMKDVANVVLKNFGVQSQCP